MPRSGRSAFGAALTPERANRTDSICGETDSAVTGNPSTLCDEYRVIFVAASGQVRFGDNSNDEASQ